MDGFGRGRRRHTPDHPSGRGDEPRDLARRCDTRLHRPLRGLCHPAGAAARCPRPRRQHTATRPAVDRQRGGLRRHGRAALLRSAGLSQQRHQALRWRHRPRRMEVRGWRRRGGRAHRRLRRREPLPHVVERPRLFRDRSRRHDEHLVHARRWRRPPPAHGARRLGRARPRSVGRPHRLPARRRLVDVRHRHRRSGRGSDHARVRLRSAPREVGDRTCPVPDLRPPAPAGQERRPDRARPGFRRARGRRPSRAGHP